MGNVRQRASLALRGIETEGSHIISSGTNRRRWCEGPSRETTGGTMESDGPPRTKPSRDRLNILQRVHFYGERVFVASS